MCDLIFKIKNDKIYLNKEINKNKTSFNHFRLWTLLIDWFRIERWAFSLDILFWVTDKHTLGLRLKRIMHTHLHVRSLARSLNWGPLYSLCMNATQVLNTHTHTYINFVIQFSLHRNDAIQFIGWQHEELPREQNEWNPL